MQTDCAPSRILQLDDRNCFYDGDNRLVAFVVITGGGNVSIGEEGRTSENVVELVGGFLFLLLLLLPSKYLLFLALFVQVLVVRRRTSVVVADAMLVFVLVGVVIMILVIIMVVVLFLGLRE